MYHFYKNIFLTLIFSISLYSCSKGEESNSNNIPNDVINQVEQISQTETPSSSNPDTSSSSTPDASNETNTTSEVSSYLGTKCKEVSYLSKPEPDQINGDYSYYTYGWQSDGTDQNSCVNSYQGVTSEGVSLVEAVLSDAKEKLGQILPVNTWIFHTQLSKSETLCSDYSPFTDDSSCFDLRPTAAATVTQYVLHNGGNFLLSEGFWSDEGKNGAGYKVAYHEYFHVHQNSHKFYFEENKNFGINMTQFRNVDLNEGVNLVGPVWLEEGGAEYAGVWYSSLKGWVSYKQYWTDYLDEARNLISDAASRGDIVSLKDYETRYTIEKVESTQNSTGTPRQFAYAYSAGGLAHIYLIEKGKTTLDDAMINYYTGLAELERDHVGAGYKFAFEKYFGMPIDDFYIEFDDFMLKTRDEQISILKLN